MFVLYLDFEANPSALYSENLNQNPRAFVCETSDAGSPIYFYCKEATLRKSAGYRISILQLYINQRLPLRPGPTGQRKSSDSNVKNPKNANMHKNSIDSLLKFTVGIIAQQILIVNKARM